MSILSIEYTTRCRVPGCTKRFVSTPFNVPIIGQPDERVVRFVTALMEHVQKKHPEQMQQIAGAIQEYMGFLIGTMFEIEDPQLAGIQERVRGTIHKVTRRMTITDAEITDRVARLGLNPDEEDGVATLLRDMRDLLTEQGRWAPKTPDPASNLVVPV